MSFRKPYILISISVLCGVLVFLLFKFNSPDEQYTGESWVVLVLDEFREDRQIRESLAAIGAFISESSQEILIDDFGAVKKIPLDYFDKEMELMDPRNDGYAAKLRAFFVRDGKRFFFMPLEDNFANKPGEIKKRLDSLLHGIPFSFTILGKTTPVLLNFALLAAACVSTLFLSRSRRLFAPVLPVLLALARGGAFAMILGVILAGIWELLREALGELSAASSYSRSKFDYAGAGFGGFLERLRPFRINLLLVTIFLLFFVAVSVTGEVPAPAPAVALACFFFIYSLSFRAETRRASENYHTPFRPVLMFPLKMKTFSLFPFLLPFAGASVLAFVLPLLLPGFSPSIDRFPGKRSENYQFIDPEYFVSSEDYRQHIAFQRSFSYQSIERSGRQEESSRNSTDDTWDLIPHKIPEGYFLYYLGEDGLIAGSSRVEESSRIDDSPFPLEKLMDFLIHYYKPGISGETGR